MGNMIEHLYEVGIQDKRTGKKFDLRIWAENTDAATHKVTDALFGADGEYRWTGSGPLYKDNKLIAREREART